MAQHPFLKSIRPVNLLSFGPNTDEIELRPLNILIGPNGGGKSNLIEIIRLLWLLPEREPWTTVLETGGVDEWIWKGGIENGTTSSVAAAIALETAQAGSSTADIRVCEYSISLAKLNSSFYVKRESVRRANASNADGTMATSFESSGTSGRLSSRQPPSNFRQDLTFQLNPERSVLSQRTSRSIQEAMIGKYMPELFEVAEFFDSFDFHQDWEFGADLTPRNPIPTGQSIETLDEDARNLAQMLQHYKDNHPQVFDQINERMKQFYEPLKRVDARLISTHLQIVIHEEGGFSIPAYRLSDGTLRWLALLVILLNPTPAPVTCIEEPELGLHPDMIPSLAGLLRDASLRTQLVITTHSQSLVECFSADPESVCVCEKIDGATRIRRLDRDKLSSWLEDYSLGQLWAKGEIGGNRW